VASPPPTLAGRNRRPGPTARNAFSTPTAVRVTVNKSASIVRSFHQEGNPSRGGSVIHAQQYSGGNDTTNGGGAIYGPSRRFPVGVRPALRSRPDPFHMTIQRHNKPRCRAGPKSFTRVYTAGIIARQHGQHPLDAGISLHDGVGSRLPGPARWTGAGLRIGDDLHFANERDSGGIGVSATGAVEPSHRQRDLYQGGTVFFQDGPRPIPPRSPAGRTCNLRARSISPKRRTLRTGSGGFEKLRGVSCYVTRTLNVQG